MDVKEGFVIKSADDEAEMELINRYTRRKYKAEEVYTFSLVLCDNQADRDYERFSRPALEKLAKLFAGKTCILDHERKSANQTARIYKTFCETDETLATDNGEIYTRLVAKAYLPRTQRSAEVIELIESGILKEVSVSCSMKKSRCGICGRESCSHVKGKSYDGVTCVRVLEEPLDAYECSFVAVPAQREAGVTKACRREHSEAKEPQNPERDNGNRDGDGHTKACGEAEKRLIEESVRLSKIAMPELKKELAVSLLSGLKEDELEEFMKLCRKLAAKRLPVFAQIRKSVEIKKTENTEFKI